MNLVSHGIGRCIFLLFLMSMADVASAARFNHGRLDAAVRQIDEEIASGRVGAAALLVARGGVVVIERGFGRISASPDSPPCRADSVFIVASITKPVTATAVMKLVEQGRVRLDERVRKYLPEFRGGERGQVTIRHLLTHTSGLPDMLPENTALRLRQAPLREFVAGAVKVPLLFTPGTRVSYQSMGILLAAEIAGRVSGRTLDDYLRQQVFDPLEMNRTSMNLGRNRLEETVQCILPGGGDSAGTGGSSNWNSPYWRNLGAPWGGMHSTVGDVFRLLQAMLENGRGVLKPELARAMVTNQTAGLNEPWGLGWKINGDIFFEGSPPGIFGHHGATGTMCFADPSRKLIFVMFTNRPWRQDEGQFVKSVARMVSDAAD
jgi:CubicO group peptidase (beta-lactamase class C family)